MKTTIKKWQKYIKTFKKMLLQKCFQNTWKKNSSSIQKNDLKNYSISNFSKKKRWKNKMTTVELLSLLQMFAEEKKHYNQNPLKSLNKQRCFFSDREITKMNKWKKRSDKIEKQTIERKHSKKIEKTTTSH